MKILHKLATGLELIPYTLEDIIEKAQKTNEKEVIITAITKRYLMTGNRDCPGEYQPIAIIGKKLIDVGNPVYVDFNPVEGIPGPMDLRHKIIKERQAEVEKILFNYIEKLCDSGINARYCDFNRGY